MNVVIVLPRMSSEVEVLADTIRSFRRLPGRPRPLQSLGDQAAPANAGGLLLVGMTPALGVETPFNTWYDNEHVPALASVPGVLCELR